MKRMLIAALAGALGLTLAGTAASGASPAASALAPGTAPAVSSVTWGSCPDDGFDYTSWAIQCSSISVPLDYSNPGGRQIKLEISERAHDPSAGPYEGIIVLNPGGPGGSGTYLPLLQEFVPGTSALQYDWIGFDPRGVGASTQVNCSSNYIRPDRPNYNPFTRHLLDYWKSAAAKEARSCANSSETALFRHMRTADNARDVDSIRKALDQDKISFYGFSWGTYLGQAYATLFPNRVDKMILDGVVDPTNIRFESGLDQAAQFADNMDAYWHYLARHPKAFHLGTKWRKIKRGYFTERRRLIGHPVAHGKLGPDELDDVMLGAGYYVYDWVELGRAYSTLVRHQKGADVYSMWADGNLGAANDNSYAAFLGVSCTDNHWPGWKKATRETWHVYHKAPFGTWGNTLFTAACFDWKFPSKAPMHITGNGINQKILMISETNDAATPFKGALKVRGMFKGASLIEGVGGTTHAGSLSGVACTDNAIATYLATGQVPTRKAGKHADKQCSPVPRPQPSSGGARLAPSAGLPAAVRHAIVTAGLGFVRG